MLITGLNSADSFSQFITVLFIFILVLALTLFTTRWIARYQKGQRNGSNIDVVETCPIGNGKYIQIVRLAESYVAIAVCKDTVTVLAKLPKEEIDFPAEHGSGLSFKELFKKAKTAYPEGEISQGEDLPKEE